MKSDKNIETYLSKYIKTQNPYNQRKVKIKTIKMHIVQDHKWDQTQEKQRFHREESNKQIYIQTRVEDS